MNQRLAHHLIDLGKGRRQALILIDLQLPAHSFTEQSRAMLGHVSDRANQAQESMASSEWWV